MIRESFNLMIVGKTGSGKSSILNSLVGDKKFPEGEGLDSETMEVCEYSGALPWDSSHNNQYSVIDTPGFYYSKKKDNQHINSIVKFLKTLKENGGINCIFFTIALTEQRFDSSIQTGLNLIKTLLGDEVFKKLKIIYTFKNNLNQVGLNRALTRFKDLPELLKTSGFPVEENIEYFIYDYDRPDDFCNQIISCVKKSPKFYPEVLDHINEVDFDLTDPMKVYKTLVENSKNIADLNLQLSNLEKIKENYEKLNTAFEEEKKFYRQQLEEKEKQIKKLNEDYLKANKEQRQVLDSIIAKNNQQIHEINQNHQNSIEKMRADSDRQIQAMRQEQLKVLNDLENKRRENEERIKKENDANVARLESQLVDLKAQNLELINRPPQIIEKTIYVESDDGGFCLIM